MEHKASYKVELLTLGYSSLAIDNRLRCITNFLNLLKKPAGLVKTKDIDYYIKYTIDKKLHSNSIHNYFTIIDQYFVFLEQRGVIKKILLMPIAYKSKRIPKTYERYYPNKKLKNSIN
ncbi:phage integrase N-terminal SAM-like domain-containing protein [Flavobacterium davisii]|uniref:Phage integrase N-terminal SAM-like domain-containing protein n=1 Tax=Flavobacterium columnare TaxID=996 RepID=A0A8G0KW16_9FLAO|nr:phage integrase N-terminal SAM-like domain-containing protein [Flavobacterium davisii]QYS90058.1 phage integrase N-terminal SAM-like domain-containing protein [Flavobacterium davisii]